MSSKYQNWNVFSEFEVDFEAGTGRISGSKDGRHHWFEITTDAEWMHDERCCRKIAP